MSYIRPCNKCGQRISMREMRAGQWVAFDASTETPHRCGKKTKADPNIKKLAKEKIKEQDSEGIDLGYSDIEGDSLSAEQADEINSKIYEVYEEASNTPPKGEKKYKKEEVIIAKKETLKEKKVNYEEPEVTETKKYQDQVNDSKYKPRDFWWYIWRLMIAVWAFVLINYALGCPFASCN